MKKMIYLLVLPSLLLSAFLLTSTADAASSEITGHYSNWSTSPETGDCGGYELWLTKSGQSLQGELAVYEGNCEADKKKIENVKYDPKTGAFSFKAPYGGTDDFYCTFTGSLRKDRISGTIRVFQKADNEQTYSGKVVLLKDSLAE